jgi:ribonuclease HI
VQKGGSVAVVNIGDPERPVVAAKLSRRGKDITCSYEEEIEAMKLALEWLETEATPNSKILICTDSNSLCNALMLPRKIELAKLYNGLARTDVNLKIKWVPAHADIPGNELADQAAKQVTRLDSPPLNTSFKAAKSLVKRNITDQPADPVKYELSRAVYDTGRITSSCALGHVPTVTRCTLPRRD